MREIVCAVSHLLLVVMTVQTVVQDPAPSKNTTKFPEIVVPPSPLPPAPAPVVKVVGEEMYVIEDDNPSIILASPEGYVTIESTGPIRIRGKFAGGGGKNETKSFTSKYVWIIEGVQSGKVEILSIPIGVKSQNQIARRMIEITTQGPRPPPEPDPKKDPDPVVPKVTKVAVVICENTIDRTVEQGKIINDDGFRKMVKDTGGFVEVVSTKDELYSKNGLKPFAEKVGLPAVILFDGDATGPSPPLDYFKMTTLEDLKARIGKVVKK